MGKAGGLLRNPVSSLTSESMVWAGGEAIGQTQLQCIMNVLDFELTVQEAIEAPRFRLAASPNFYKPANPVSMCECCRVTDFVPQTCERGRAAV